MRQLEGFFTPEARTETNQESFIRGRRYNNKVVVPNSEEKDECHSSSSSISSSADENAGYHCAHELYKLGDLTCSRRDGMQQYASACAEVGIVPSCYVQGHLASPQLNVRNMLLTEKGAYALSRALAVNHYLTVVGLSNNGLKDQGAVDIAKALHTNTCISRLDLSANMLTNVAGEKLAAMVAANKTLQELNLAKNRLGDAFAIAMEVALRSNTSLQVLDVSGNRIAVGGGRAFANACRNSKELHTFNIGWNDLRAAAGAYFLKTVFMGLTNNNNNNNNTGSSGGASLAGSTYGIGIGAGAMGISTYITGHRPSAAGPPTGYGGTAYGYGGYSNTGHRGSTAAVGRAGHRHASIAQAMPPPTVVSSILSLEMAFNGLNDVVGVVLGSVLISRHCALVHIDVSRNRLGSASALAVSKALLSNTSLQVLKMGWNPFGLEATSALISALALNQTVQVLRIENTTDAGTELQLIQYVSQVLAGRWLRAEVVVEYPDRTRVVVPPIRSSKLDELGISRGILSSRMTEQESSSSLICPERSGVGWHSARSTSSSHHTTATTTAHGGRGSIVMATLVPNRISAMSLKCIKQPTKEELEVELSRLREESSVATAAVIGGGGNSGGSGANDDAAAAELRANRIARLSQLQLELEKRTALELLEQIDDTRTKNTSRDRDRGRDRERRKAQSSSPIKKKKGQSESPRRRRRRK